MTVELLHQSIADGQESSQARGYPLRLMTRRTFGLLAQNIVNHRESAPRHLPYDLILSSRRPPG
ncbi:MAG: hypothetical protein O2955_18180 [Planctomycetota bacterium]|nr:hypothetical protein [Planctomycetota bacterium]MDA1214440.1 hypothetical protein [Planctomycetota bacterium]